MDTGNRGPSSPTPNGIVLVLRKLSTLVAALVLGFLTIAAAEDGPEVDPQVALAEGNRHFEEGRYDEAAAAYQQGYSSATPHPTLLYNLGATLHHLDRLPEAILWYRRADTKEDAWLQENLWLARRSLGSQQLPPGGLFGWLGRHTTQLQVVAIGLSWATLLILILWNRIPNWLPGVLAFLAATLFVVGLAVERWGPHPAVLLEDCVSGAGEVPAGTEAWVRRTTAGWSVSGTAGMVCPAESAALIFPGT